MSRRSDGLTAELFSSIPAATSATPASMDFRKPVAQLVSQLLKGTPDSRYVIAARMSELADHETSKFTLDSYTAESRDACNIPLWKVPVMEVATGSRILAEWHAQVLGGRVLWGSDVLDADIGQRERLIHDLQQEVKDLKRYQKRVR